MHAGNSYATTHPNLGVIDITCRHTIRQCFKQPVHLPHKLPVRVSSRVAVKAQIVQLQPVRLPASMQQCSQHSLELHAALLCECKRERYKRVDEDAPDGFLAKGSFGKVYIAEDTKTGQVVAIKKQRYPSAEAARELAFAKVLASSPSVLIIKYLIRLNVEIGR